MLEPIILELDSAGPPEGWPRCRVCGCWEYAACGDEGLGPCWWVESDLCSHCA